MVMIFKNFLALKKCPRFVHYALLMDAFEGGNMQFEYRVLGYRIDLYFHDYKLAIEVDEKVNKDRNIDHEIKRPKALEKELGCEFIRIDPDEKDFNISKVKN